ncbi:glycoside hydrolase family 3 N-terminal domain-containing protein [Falsarthrobacter nasiphocae]|uniref:beta-N-acetylhexosaminidase n=1 Tax=Falsarthrobacter nasiphocae TaxID=189863 RepID=A0AAE3YHZ6_9MICC|nr:glycoside hydrolase family 3 N-terminal domain-containing protein [Falsarthrobacter nasiphocae]MDR6892565.1 beta-N-acetylhexosaminidase [Falsarthrobacter nasiphocae]
MALLASGCSGAPEPQASSSASPSASSSGTTTGSTPSTGPAASPSASPSASARASASPSASDRPEPLEDKLAGPSEEQYETAKKYVQGMSTADKAGAVLVQKYAGTDPNRAAALARDLKLGGTIIMGDNIPMGADGAADLDELRSALSTLTAGVKSRPWGSILTIDQEGGAVARLRAPLTEWPTPMTFGAAGDTTRTEKAAAAMNSELGGLGFNLNNATLADMTIGADDPTIGARSYGSEQGLVSRMAVASIEGAAKAGVVTSVKHFPGHGSVTTDSHVGLPVQKKSLAELKRTDFVPFQQTIDAGASVMMMGHIEVPALQAGVPSSLSAPAYRQLRSMGFTGVIMTDALNMGAITEQYGASEAAVKALSAGADLLLMPEDVAEAHSGIVSAVAAKKIPVSRLDEAATRVVALGLWQKSLVAQRMRVAEPGSGADAARSASAAGATLLTGQCTGRLLPSKTVTLVSGTAEEKQRFMDAAKAAGLTVGPGGRRVALAADGSAPVDADIAVATDGPWVLASSPAKVKIALYSSTPPAFAALSAILLGTVKPGGHLPTKVGTYPVGTGCGE